MMKVPKECIVFLDTCYRILYVTFLYFVWALQKIYNFVFDRERISSCNLEKHTVSCPISKDEWSKSRKKFRYKNYPMSPIEEAMLRCACGKGYTKKKCRRIA